MHKNERALLSIITILTNDMTRFTMDIVTKRAEERVTFTCVQWVKLLFFCLREDCFPSGIPVLLCADRGGGLFCNNDQKHMEVLK